MIFDDLLSALNSTEFQALRPMQTSVLTQYASLLTSDGKVKKSDLAIEMPAGTGKTLVILLIAEYHLQRKRKVAILTGTRQLANQVDEDAEYLGVNTAVFEGPGKDWGSKEVRKYHRAETIGIMNYWAYFNVNPKPEPAEILIFDDAHLAENAISNLFSVRVGRNENDTLYTRIIKAIRSCRPGRYTAIEDILTEMPSESPFLLPFSDWHQLSDQLTQLLDDASEAGDGQIRYVWPRLRRNCDALALFVTSREVQLRPVIYPTETLRHFSDPVQRLYLSATLGDPGDLQRRIGCAPLCLLRPSDPRPGERGRRMIVLFPSREEHDDRDAVVDNGLHKLWPVARKRLWMCSSWREAEEWKARVPPLRNGTRSHILELRGSDESQLEEFRQRRLGHLFTAGRYDGIDFPGDQCRLAIIPSPPITSDPQEEFFSAYLQDAAFLKARFSQRVAQALGRCNREAADFAVYLFPDSRFENRFGGNDPDYLSYLPRDIQAEMEAALESCEDGFEACCVHAGKFLSGSFADWDDKVRDLLEETPQESRASSASTARFEVAGWLALWKGDPVGADSSFRKCEETYVALRSSGPLAFSRYCRAWANHLCHLRQDDPSALRKSIELLERAAAVGPSSWFTTVLRGSANDLRRLLKDTLPPAPAVDDYEEAIVEQWESILFERGLREPSLRKWLDKIEEGIGCSTHDIVAERVADLGRLLGFEAFRPRHSGLPDVIWRFSRGPRYIFTWEVKAELAANRKVSLRDVNQAHGHGRWASNNYSRFDYQCHPFILACCGDLEEGVIDRLGDVRCVSQSVMQSMARTVREIFEGFRALWSANSSEQRLQARERVCSRLPNVNWLCEAHQSARPGFIPEEVLLSEWRSVDQ